MHDVVAVEVEIDNGQKRYFVTWGRIQHRVDGAPIADLVLRHAGQFLLGGRPVRARLCPQLREAADSASAPYFYEAFLAFARHPIPYGDGYEGWRTDLANAMGRGEEINYCGNPDQIAT